MRITFLGTGTPAAMPCGTCPCRYCAGYRHEGRTGFRPLVLVSEGETNILLDLGPDVRQQLLGHPVAHLEAVLGTHAHFDHFGGLVDFGLTSFWGMNAPTIFLNQGHREYCRTCYPWVRQPYEVVAYRKPFRVGALTVTAYETVHAPSFETCCYVLENGKGGRFLYLPDAHGPRNEGDYAGMRAADLAVTDGSYALGELFDPLGSGTRLNGDPTHPTREELGILWKSLGASATRLLQVSEHFFQKSHDEIDALLPDRIRVARDGMVVEI